MKIRMTQTCLEVKIPDDRYQMSGKNLKSNIYHLKSLGLVLRILDLILTKKQDFQ